MAPSAGRYRPDVVEPMSPSSPLVAIIEHDPAGALYLRGATRRGTVEVITNVRFDEQTAYLDELHVDGPGAGSMGVRDLRVLARELARQLQVRRVVIQGGVRTTGARPGRVPRQVTIRIEGD